MKTCYSCKQEKELSDFYKNKSKPDGVTCECKICKKLQAKIWSQNNKEKKRDSSRADYIKNKEKYNAMSRKWAIDNKEKILDITRRHYLNNKEAIIKKGQERRIKYIKQYKAISRVSCAIKSGELIKMPCEVCGNIKSEAHHCDYDKQLDVMWLCRKHHKEWHDINGKGLNLNN